MLSYRKKFIFIHIPRTAGTSIEHVLRPYALKGFPKHQTIRQIQDDIGRLDKFYKFAVVRNPWEKMVSHFFHHKRSWKWQKYFRETNLRITTFGEWLTKVDKVYAFKKDNIITPDLRSKNQLQWITDDQTAKSRIMVDFVARYENLEEDWQRVCKAIGIGETPLPQRNRTEHLHYREYYDDYLANIVWKRFREDIEFFGYKFI